MKRILIFIFCALLIMQVSSAVELKNPGRNFGPLSNYYSYIFIENSNSGYYIYEDGKVKRDLPGAIDPKVGFYEKGIFFDNILTVNPNLEDKKALIKLGKIKIPPSALAKLSEGQDNININQDLQSQAESDLGFDFNPSKFDTLMLDSITIDNKLMVAINIDGNKVYYIDPSDKMVYKKGTFYSLVGKFDDSAKFSSLSLKSTSFAAQRDLGNILIPYLHVNSIKPGKTINLKIDNYESIFNIAGKPTESILVRNNIINRENVVSFVSNSKQWPVFIKPNGNVIDITGRDHGSFSNEGDFIAITNLDPTLDAIFRVGGVKVDKSLRDKVISGSGDTIYLNSKAKSGLDEVGSLTQTVVYGDNKYFVINSEASETTNTQVELGEKDKSASNKVTPAKYIFVRETLRDKPIARLVKNNDKTIYYIQFEHNLAKIFHEYKGIFGTFRSNGQLIPTEMGAHNRIISFLPSSNLDIPSLNLVISHNKIYDVTNGELRGESSSEDPQGTTEGSTESAIPEKRVAKNGDSPFQAATESKGSTASDDSARSDSEGSVDRSSNPSYYNKPLTIAEINFYMEMVKKILNPSTLV